jgi:hypothetical protein
MSFSNILDLNAALVLVLILLALQAEYGHPTIDMLVLGTLVLVATMRREAIRC